VDHDLDAPAREAHRLVPKRYKPRLAPTFLASLVRLRKADLMVHPNTESLTEYWRVRAPAFGCPPRTSVDPTEFLQFLPQVFILGRTAPGRYPFRLVGGLVADLHGREVRAEDFLGHWASEDRAPLQSAMEGAARRAHPLIVEAELGSLPLEVLLAPLAGPEGAPTRFLGLYQPLAGGLALVTRTGGPLRVRRLGITAGGQIVADAPRLRLAALDGRRIA
jgi:hypothetical protein